MSDGTMQDILKALPAIVQQCVFDTKKNTFVSFIGGSDVAKVCEKLAINKQQLGEMLLPVASTFSHAPISNFHVGSVVFDNQGNAYMGANFEFANDHLAQSFHAEQSAIAHAWSCGATALELMVISHPPCGHCRQFINEVTLSDGFAICLPQSEPQPLEYYLPQPFGPKDLGIESQILSSSYVNFTSADCLSLHAEYACLYSHAPYTNNQSGVAIRFADGSICTGSYAENAAFNPSMPPLQMALNIQKLRGNDWQNIVEVVMYEKTSHRQTSSTQHNSSQQSNTQNLLTNICQQARFSYYTL